MVPMFRAINAGNHHKAMVPSLILAVPHQETAHQETSPQIKTKPIDRMEEGVILAMVAAQITVVEAIDQMGVVEAIHVVGEVDDNR